MDTNLIELNGLASSSIASSPLSLSVIFEETLRGFANSTLNVTPAAIEIPKGVIDEIEEKGNISNTIASEKKKIEKKYKEIVFRKNSLEGYISDIQTSLKMLNDNSRMKESYQNNLIYFQNQLDSVEDIKLEI